MRHESILIILILSEVVLVAISMASELVLAPFLPDLLRGFAIEGGAGRGLSDELRVLWVAVVVTSTISWIGLLNLVRGARPLYLGSWVAYFFLILNSGPVVSTAMGFVAQMLGAVTSGAIIGLVYFSELRTKFRPLAEVVRELKGSPA